MSKESQDRTKSQSNYFHLGNSSTRKTDSVKLRVKILYVNKTRDNLSRIEFIQRVGANCPSP